METKEQADEIISPYQFCMDFFKEIQLASPLDRKPIVLGYAQTLEAMLQAKYAEGQRDGTNKH